MTEGENTRPPAFHHHQTEEFNYRLLSEFMYSTLAKIDLIVKIDRKRQFLK